MNQSDADLIRFGDLEATPWANGGGTTRVVAVDPAPDWAWRLSIADIDVPGAFSGYPGIDRVLVQLSEGRLVLDVDGEAVPLGRFGSIAFDGALPVSCEIPDGPTRDLNLMTRRGVVTGAVRIETAYDALTIEAASDETFAVVLDGTLALPGEPLQLFDAVRCCATVELLGSGTIAIVTVDRVRTA